MDEWMDGYFFPFCLNAKLNGILTVVNNFPHVAEM